MHCSIRYFSYSTCCARFFFLFFFNDTATTEIYTLSLHDALPICLSAGSTAVPAHCHHLRTAAKLEPRSEEHTSELQSRLHLVCRLLLEKKKIKGNMWSNVEKYSQTGDWLADARRPYVELPTSIS